MLLPIVGPIAQSCCGVAVPRPPSAFSGHAAHRSLPTAPFGKDLFAHNGRPSRLHDPPAHPAGKALGEMEPLSSVLNAAVAMAF